MKSSTSTHHSQNTANTNTFSKPNLFYLTFICFADVRPTVHRSSQPPSFFSLCWMTSLTVIFKELFPSFVSMLAPQFHYLVDSRNCVAIKKEPGSGGRLSA